MWVFFVMCEVDEASVGQSKAKSACAFLQELNDSVKAKLSRLSTRSRLETTVRPRPSMSLLLAVEAESSVTIAERLVIWRRIVVVVPVGTDTVAVDMAVRDATRVVM